MEVRKGYKQVDDGIIPEEWNEVELNEVSSITRLAGAEYTSVWEETPNGEIIALRGFNIGANKIIERETVCISNTLSLKLSRSRLCKGDVIYPCVGSIGNAAVIYDDNKYHIQQNIARITPTKSLLPEYLAYYLMSPLGMKQVFKFNGSSSQPSVLVGSLRKYKLPLPPTSEQQAIATALSDVDALISSLEKLIAKKRDIKQATMQQLLTGKKRLQGFEVKKGYKKTELGEIPEDWEVKKMGEMIFFYQPETIAATMFKESGYPVYGANGVVGYFDRYNHEENQVTITCRGSTCGTVNMTVPKSWITGNAMVASCEGNKKIDKNFLYYLLLNQDLSACITGSGQPQIVRSPLVNFVVSVPSSLIEQQAIANVLSDFDSEINHLIEKLNKTQLLKQGMMQELLTGRIRLI